MVDNETGPNRIDLAEATKRIQKKLHRYESLDKPTYYHKGMIDGLDYALYLLNVAEAGQQGQSDKEL